MSDTTTPTARRPDLQNEGRHDPPFTQLGALQERLFALAEDTALADRLASQGDSSGGADAAVRWRAAIQVLSGRMADNLDGYWRSAKAAPEGPIDVIDMFSGCGGMSAGFRAVNGLLPAFRLALAVDINEAANATYAANLGSVPVREDISTLASSKLRLDELLRSSGRRPDHPLILIGCAPCQGFSSHRNAAGEGDVRNSLFEDFAQVAVNLMPEAIVVENVPELLTNKYWPYVENARRILEGAGYFVHLDVHNMAEFGVPQERFRAVMLALRKPFGRPRGFLRRGEFRTVRQAIGSLPAIRSGEPNVDDSMHYTAGHKESTLATIRAVPRNGGSRPADVGPQCLQRAFERRGRAIYEDIYGRLYWDRPAITITGYARNPASGRFVHPEQDRGLSVREAALLQGFPSDYWFEGGLDQRFQQVGNAVPPAFSAYLALYLLGELLSPSPPAEWAGPGITTAVGTSFSRMIPGIKSQSGAFQTAFGTE